MTVPTLTSALLQDERLTHAFFTRQGGVSAGLFAGLNVGLGSSDDPAHVSENRRRAAAALGLPESALVTAYQVHSADVAVVEAPWAAGQGPKVDGLVTATPGLALGILTADCAPVLLADARAGVIGAAHAGWRGAVGGVLDATLAEMERLGARRGRIAAAVGPCIGRLSYQVGAEFPAPFLAEADGNARFFLPDPAGDGRWRFDLAGYVVAKLQTLGVGGAEALPHDTCADEARFFSYRRSCLRGEPDYGRGLSAIALA
jgi:YfiH family protein